MEKNGKGAPVVSASPEFARTALAERRLRFYGEWEYSKEPHMPETPAPLQIPQDILVQVYAHARKAFPAECCGWLAGPRGGDGVTTARPCDNAQSQGIHPTAAMRGAETAYVFSKEDVLAFNEGIDSEEPPLIIYHSHPNGRSYLSNVDMENATDPWGDGKMFPVQQLVVGIDAERVVEAKLFDWSDEERTFVEIAGFAVEG